MPDFWWPPHRGNDILNADPDVLGDADHLGHWAWQPPTYGDWWETRNPYDNRDELSPHFRDPWTGLPPRDHQGREYAEDEWAETNGDGRDGWWYHYNEPREPRPDGKPHRKAFVWPSDGKRKSTWGRWKDILDAKGPDIFVGNLGDRPTRNHWKNRVQELNPGETWQNTHRATFWARRPEEKHYNFKSRKYERDRPGRYTWADAVWPRRDADQHDFPLSFRCKHGDWFNIRWAPFGGVPLPHHTYKRTGDDRRGIWK